MLQEFLKLLTWTKQNKTSDEARQFGSLICTMFMGRATETEVENILSNKNQNADRPLTTIWGGETAKKKASERRLTEEAVVKIEEPKKRRRVKSEPKPEEEINLSEDAGDYKILDYGKMTQEQYFEHFGTLKEIKEFAKTIGIKIEGKETAVKVIALIKQKINEADKAEEE